MSKILPRRPSEIKKKEEENAKKEAEARRILEAKVEQAKQSALRKKTAQRLHTLSLQADNQQHILTQVVADMQTLGQESKRIEQVIAVLKKVEIVLAQESAKL